MNRRELLQVGAVGAGLVPGPRVALDRRELLQALAALGLSVSPEHRSLWLLQQNLEDKLGPVGERDLPEWEQCVDDYGYSYLVTPPAELVSDLVIDLAGLDTILQHRMAGGRRRDWCRVLSSLTMVLAKCLANAGQSREARNWWLTAEHAATASGDGDLHLWVSAERLVHGLYERRPAGVLLARADAVLAAGAPAAPGRGLAELQAIRAQLLASAGRHDEAGAALRQARSVLEQVAREVSRPGSIANWNEANVAYTQAWVHAHAGRAAQLDETVATARAHLSVTQRRTRVQIDLLQAFGHTRAGDVTEGVRAATALYCAGPPEQRTTMISSLAGMVLEAVPSHHKSHPGVAGYADLLTRP